MILTITPNPSIDATLTLPDALRAGTVQRLSSVTHAAGGKGVNVSHAVHLAGHETVAVFPSAESDPFLPLVRELGLRHRVVPVDGTVRTNTTVTSPDGETTKLNGPGPVVDETVLSGLLDTVPAILTQSSETSNPSLSAADGHSHWVVLAGSLPSGAPTDWYVHAIAQLRTSLPPEVRIAVDTSDDALRAFRAFRTFRTLTDPAFPAPDVIKPNGFELGQLLGLDGELLETEAKHGNITPVATAARQALDSGVVAEGGAVLVTLGGAGAVLATCDGLWRAYPPHTSVVSTVGAGDSSLAGFILAQVEHSEPSECLRRAIAYGSAAAGLPGTAIPSPSQIDLAGTRVEKLALL